MCFRPAEVSLKPKCPACDAELDIPFGGTLEACPECGHAFTEEEIASFFSGSGAPGAPAAPKAPGA